MSIAILPTQDDHEKDTVSIEWKNPPAPKGRGNTNQEYEKIAAELRKHPGQWALVAHDIPTSKVGNIKHGLYAAFRPAGAFEACSRGVTPNKNRAAELYVRYIGGGEA